MRAGGWRSTKYLCKAGVFVYADGHVDCRRGDELCRAGRHGRVGLVAEGGGDGVDGVCGEVGCAVQGVDEEEGGAEEEAGGSGDHGLEAGGDGLADWEAF